jgi:hypothetical protein
MALTDTWRGGLCVAPWAHGHQKHGPARGPNGLMAGGLRVDQMSTCAHGG